VRGDEPGHGSVHGSRSGEESEDRYSEVEHCVLIE
jgi:hypothetical protein